MFPSLVTSYVTGQIGLLALLLLVSMYIKQHSYTFKGNYILFQTILRANKNDTIIVIIVIIIIIIINNP